MKKLLTLAALVAAFSLLIATWPAEPARAAAGFRPGMMHELMLPQTAASVSTGFTADRLNKFTSSPGCPVAGYLYYDTTADTVKACNNALTAAVIGTSLPDLTDSSGVSVASAVLFTAPSIRIGTNPAQTTGTLNLPNNVLVCWRNNANNADICPIRVNSGDIFTAGNTTFTGTQVNLSVSNANLNFTGGKGQHITTQAANNDLAGVATCSTSTIAVTFTNNYTSTPVIVVSDETAAGGARVSAKSNSGFTITCSGASDVVDYVVIANPT